MHKIYTYNQKFVYTKYTLKVQMHMGGWLSTANLNMRFIVEEIGILFTNSDSYFIICKVHFFHRITEAKDV